ncbi:orotidine 5'-phosphate decarboxylase [Paracoccidioides lutzii Pb01]|uniref:Orotidine 5'-phosphate decarboxylase n=1 Tax=Paracoccidioides lutzii (strain ATCC MYA-826 / Pb01) TaxID=502779 RepID=C1H9T8_PARBA|nr:orotidine 5'-phosphate decarboxylase [Paracoccidioides lutzii Pb01]EEH37111.2 orotidine 5'-phosphate decarboxylase [Paracoccidioides lutzii Pb01]
MSSKSHIPYAVRASRHSNPLAKQLFQIAEEKKSNVVVSADVTTSKELLDLADRLGPYITVLKTHIDILTDLSPTTLTTLKSLASKYRFLLFEDRKFVDIGSTVQKQYHGGSLRISEWAHIVNCAMLAGPGIVDALAQTASTPEFRNVYADEAEGGRALLILAEMTSKGSMATGAYTQLSVEAARRHRRFVLGFVATRALNDVLPVSTVDGDEEDFVVFTTGVNLSASGDALGQQYQTPASAVQRGADFIISGRGIYAAEDPLEAVLRYREEGWKAYLERVKGYQA